MKDEHDELNKLAQATLRKLKSKTDKGIIPPVKKEKRIIIDIPKEELDGDTELYEKRIWFLTDNITVFGPYTKIEIHHLVDDKKLNARNITIWGLDHREDWKDLGQWLTQNPAEEPVKLVYYTKNTKGYCAGPFDLEQMITLFKTEQLPISSTLLWTMGAKQWYGFYEDKHLPRSLGLNRRKYTRIPIKGKIVLRNRELKMEFVAPILTISQGGFSTAFVEGFSEGQEFSVEIISDMLTSIDKTPHPVHAQARVVAKRTEMVGFEFAAISTEALTFIMDYIKKFNAKPSLFLDKPVSLDSLAQMPPIPLPAPILKLVPSIPQAPNSITPPVEQGRPALAPISPPKAFPPIPASLNWQIKKPS